jgi:hypothetical protein
VVEPSRTPSAASAGTNVAPPAYGTSPPAYGAAPPTYGAPSYGATPPAYGATEAQPSPSTGAQRESTWGQRETDDQRLRVAQSVATASSQIDRLQRVQSSAVGTRRENVGDALYSLERRRAKVLQDLRALDAEPPGQRAALRSELERDLADLQDSVYASYALSPPPSQGMPPPAPLPPR